MISQADFSQASGLFNRDSSEPRFMDKTEHLLENNEENNLRKFGKDPPFTSRDIR